MIKNILSVELDENEVIEREICDVWNEIHKLKSRERDLCCELEVLRSQKNSKIEKLDEL